MKASELLVPSSNCGSGQNSLRTEFEQNFYGKMANLTEPTIIDYETEDEEGEKH